LEQGHKEGSYVYYHGGYYYLFWQTGSCCSGTASTYEINMARATAITGPYTDDRIFYASTGDVHGPGQIGIYSCGGVERFTYHYYPTAESILGENELTWSSDDWPVVGAVSTTSLKLPCEQASVSADGGVDAASTLDAGSGVDATSPALDATVVSDAGAGSDVTVTPDAAPTSEAGSEAATGVDASVGTVSSDGGQTDSATTMLGSGSDAGGTTARIGEAGSGDSGTANMGDSSGCACTTGGGSSRRGSLATPTGGLIGLVLASRRRRKDRGRVR
jgi:MYXO-CTERM domain-containing protein